jgi:(2Fe-2S) ferredoxin
MPAPVVVYKDVGGLVSDYEAITERYRVENREVRLHECRSACTLALSLPNVCVYPDAKVKFHQAYNAINREVDFGVSSRLFASYPAAVQARLGHLTREYRVLTGTELIALGMRNCESGPTMIASRKQRATSTRLASAQSDGPSGASLASFGDIAHKVQSAVATALSGAGGPTTTPIRVAVADRQRVADLPRENEANALPETAPLPPRRPSAEAFAAPNQAPMSAAYLQLISGAQPILSPQLVRTVATN